VDNGSARENERATDRRRIAAAISRRPIRDRRTIARTPARPTGWLRGPTNFL
jgi:hypothetical protein